MFLSFTRNTVEPKLLLLLIFSKANPYEVYRKLRCADAHCWQQSTLWKRKLGPRLRNSMCVVLHTKTSNMRVHCDMSALHITPCGQQTPNLLGPLCVRALCIFHLDMHTHIAATPKHSQPHARTHGRTHTNTYIMIMAHPGRNQAGGYSQRTCLSNTDCSA